MDLKWKPMWHVEHWREAKLARRSTVARHLRERTSWFKRCCII